MDLREIIFWAAIVVATIAWISARTAAKERPLREKEQKVRMVDILDRLSDREVEGNRHTADIAHLRRRIAELTKDIRVIETSTRERIEAIEAAIRQMQSSPK